MKLEVNISKKYLFIIIAVIVVVAAIVGVIAASHPNPGHDFETELGNVPETAIRWPTWSEVSSKPAYNQCSGLNKALKTINLQTGQVTCETDDAGGGGITSCVKRQASSAWGGAYGGQHSSVNCNGNEYRTGGGGSCAGNAMWLQSSAPVGNNPGGGWKISCPWSADPGTRAWVVCCS